MNKKKSRIIYIIWGIIAGILGVIVGVIHINIAGFSKMYRSISGTEVPLGVYSSERLGMAIVYLSIIGIILSCLIYVSKKLVGWGLIILAVIMIIFTGSFSIVLAPATLFLILGIIVLLIK
ncbi:hypothetical protein [Defluviitalea phaphyphila]|uniref:hypothetical protein n=1 Tax=Defluviitalea phaphyphila TaxID=1473580 RepID=UPI0007319F1D|nr:hypothetical protein [Defluviitalea phaphyphila]